MNFERQRDKHQIEAQKEAGVLRKMRSTPVVGQYSN